MADHATTAVQDIEEIQRLIGAKVDGDIGRITKATVRSISNESLAKKVQIIIARRFPVALDGIIGPETIAALNELDEVGDRESARDVAKEIGENAGDMAWRNKYGLIYATSFADPADVAGFRRCKAHGNSDLFCFGQGDNGIGAWGANTADGGPMFALPREVWRLAGKRGGARAVVTYQGKRVEAELGDTMPALANIKNKAFIDMNPALCRALGLELPVRVKGVDFTWI